VTNQKLWHNQCIFVAELPHWFSSGISTCYQEWKRVVRILGHSFLQFVLFVYSSIVREVKCGRRACFNGEKKVLDFTAQCKSLDLPLMFLYFASEEPDFLVIFLKWSWAIAHRALWRSFKVFVLFCLFWRLTAFSLIFSPVHVPDHFQWNVFSCLLSHLRLTYKSFKH